MKRLLVIMLAFASAFALNAQTSSPKKIAPEKPSTRAVPPIPQTTPGDTTVSAPIDKNAPPLDPKNMDTSVKPADDFYLYANGGWIKRNPIPPEFSRWGSFNMLAEQNNDALKVVAEKAAADAPKVAAEANPEKAEDADLQKVGDFYASGMDEKAVDTAKAQPLNDELKRIDSMKERGDVLKEIAHLHSIGMTALFRFGANQDAKNSEMVIGQLYQGGLALPDRDYYTKEDAGSKKIRDQYVEHMTKMFALLGEPQDKAAEHAKKVLAIETSLAQPARTRVQLRDPQKNYNKMKQVDLQTLTPEWSWENYFKEIKLAQPGDINVGQPEFFQAADKVFASTPVDDWKIYLRWHLLHGMAPSLSKNFVDEDFNFFQKTLTGAQQLKPRWKRVVAKTDEEIGESLGKLYVADNFPPEAKARALELVNNLREALADRIKALDWMDDATKQEALKKLAALTVKIGYPDKWRDYSLLKIDRSSYAMNVLRGETFERARRMAQIGKPVDRSEWGMTPPTVNAYYNASRNEIVFPAGILQPPFFNAKADDAVNYGGIGAVIGHEMTHGFDDRGRQYDAVGNLRDWWTPESAKAYIDRSKAIVAEYSGFEPLPGLHINGELTQGENIADIGGVRISYMALQKALAKKGPQPKIDGFTPEQRFFLAYAQIWRNNQRDEDLKLRLNTDPHSPGRFRTIGPLSNFVEFQKAFDIPDGSPMMRPADQRVNIW
ncbi:MAG TPA: M13 family metallopeptidase [Chthoniobacterales bacterium]|nr:M13 family metallopeptidase [Chthoniobacterales bacterium]